MDWDIEKHDGIPYRLACRAKLLLDGKRTDTEMSARELLRYLLAKGNGTYKPKWLRTLDLSRYDDSWENWKLEEIGFVKERAAVGYDPEVLQDLFRVPDQMMKDMPLPELNPLKPSRRNGPGDLPDEFTNKDIPEPGMRIRANKEFSEYARELDMTNPANRVTVRMLIIIGIKIRDIERQLLDTGLSAKDNADLLSTYQALGKQYSAAAEDVAALEKQREKRDVAHTFAMLVEREEAISREWIKNKTREHQRLEESTLIEHMVTLHKIDIGGEGETPAQRIGNIDRRKRSLPEGVSTEEAIQINEDKHRTIAVAAE